MDIVSCWLFAMFIAATPMNEAYAVYSKTCDQDRETCMVRARLLAMAMAPSGHAMIECVERRDVYS